MSAKINLTPEVITVLDAATLTDHSVALTQTLDRKLYLQVNAALEALGGKWDRKAKAHLFEDDPRLPIERAILTGSVIDTDKELDFFETPQPVAYHLIDLADIRPGHKVLEPSVGKGAILSSLRTDYDFWETVDVCEIDEKRLAWLEKLNATRIMAADFLTFRPVFQYDRVIANPPFSQRRDLVHILRMYDLLKSGGRLVSVMSAGIAFRQDARTKAFLEAMPYHSVENLPPDSFRDSGTGVNTVLFTAVKR